MINSSSAADVISVLSKDDETFERLKTDFPDILADLLTFRNNPNCSCKGRVAKFFSSALQKNPDILDKYVKDPQSLNRTLETLSQQRLNNNYSGRIMKIENTEEAWKKLALELSNKTFRAFSTVEKDGQLWVYIA